MVINLIKFNFCYFESIKFSKKHDIPSFFKKYFIKIYKKDVWKLAYQSSFDLFDQL